MSSDSGGNSSVSIVIATAGRSRMAAILGDGTNVHITSSSPVQWNQIGMTRGVPSLAVYARRAGTVELSMRFAMSLSRSSRSPCTSAIVSPLLFLRRDRALVGVEEVGPPLLEG